MARMPGSPTTALEAAEEFRPEMVLLDIGLTDMDGYEVDRSTWKRPWSEDLVIIALTG